MRFTYLTIVITTLFFAACNSQQNKTENKDSVNITGATDSTPATHCYQYIKDKDSVEMKVVYMGNAVSGSMTYKLSGKDRNNGTFSGDMNGSLIVAYYTFFSEGRQSVRQIALKQEKGSLTEGYGYVYTRNDSVLFRNIDSLQFDKGIKLDETPCQ